MSNIKVVVSGAKYLACRENNATITGEGDTPAQAIADLIRKENE